MKNEKNKNYEVEKINIAENVEDKSETKTVKKTYMPLTVFFLAVVLIFTVINIGETVSGKDDALVSGLNDIAGLENGAITVWGAIQNFFGKTQAFGVTEKSDVVKMSNGYSFMPETDYDISPAMEGVMRGKELAVETGADFLYVAVPVKQLDSRYYPEGIQDNAPEKYEAMLDYLSASNIEYIDGRSVLEDTQRDWFDYFYKSDHHPNNDAAFEIYKSVCERMSTYGYDISEEYLERDSFEITEYKDIFWGSHTRMAGPVFTGTDDYSLYLPKFDTDMEYDVPFENIHREGNFEDALCFYENLSEKSFDMYAYYAYLHQDYELIRITDNMKPDGPDIVIVRDSTAVPVSAFLSLQAHTVTLIDLRYLENYSPEEYIREINPDIIIYMFGTGYLCESDAMIIR